MNLKQKPIVNLERKFDKNTLKFKVLNEYSNKISGDAFKLYYILIDYYNDAYGYAYPSYSILLDKTGIKSVNTLKKKLNELVEIGLINISTGTKNNQYTFNNVFELKEVKIEKSEKNVLNSDDEKSKFDSNQSKNDRPISKFDSPYNIELTSKFTSNITNTKSNNNTKVISMYDKFLVWSATKGCNQRSINTLLLKFPKTKEWLDAYMTYIDSLTDIDDLRTYIGVGIKKNWNMNKRIEKPKEEPKTPQWQLDRIKNRRLNTYSKRLGITVAEYIERYGDEV
jgi:hypothetical protein